MVVGATGAVMLFYLVTMVLGLFHVSMPFMYNSSPLSLGLSLVIIAIAALNLVLDFDLIESASRRACRATWSGTAPSACWSLWCGCISRSCASSPRRALAETRGYTDPRARLPVAAPRAYARGCCQRLQLTPWFCR